VTGGRGIAARTLARVMGRRDLSLTADQSLRKQVTLVQQNTVAARIRRAGGRLLRAMTSRWRRRLRAVPIELMLCDNAGYKGQPFAGAPLSEFPMVKVFELFQTDPATAYACFGEWIRGWFFGERGWQTPKTEGGMADGSLFRLIQQLHRESKDLDLVDFNEADPELVDQAVRQRAEYYCNDVFESIRRDGYKEVGAPITYIRNGDRYLLKNGHHRAAAALVLGYTRLRACPF